MFGMKKRNAKLATDLPPPPEPEFFDEPKRTKKAAAFMGDLFAKRPVRLLLAFLLVAAVLLALFYRPPKKKLETQTPRTEEKRLTLTTQTMERAIDQSRGGKPERAREGKAREGLRKSRKLGSPIAVFVEKPEPSRSNVSSRTREGEIKLGIPAGTKIPAILSDRVFSFNVAAPVTATLPKDFPVKDQVMIPKDSRFLGEVNVLKSVDRINVRFDLLILPDGRELRIRAIALSEDGSSGIRGKVNKHTDTKVLKAVGETLLAGASLFVGGRRQDPYNLEDQLRVNLAENLTNQAGQDLRSVKVDKSITVESGIPIQVMLLEAI